jgi:hypothetical protein
LLITKYKPQYTSKLSTHNRQTIIYNTYSFSFSSHTGCRQCIFLFGFLIYRQNIIFNLHVFFIFYNAWFLSIYIHFQIPSCHFLRRAKHVFFFLLSSRCFYIYNTLCKTIGKEQRTEMEPTKKTEHQTGIFNQ